MSDHVILLSIPGLREQALKWMPNLASLEGDRATLVPSAPAVTCPVQVNMTTGETPSEHGIVANGLYDREKDELEMWTAWNSAVERPQIWDRLREAAPGVTTAVWFPLLVKGCAADFICTPAPIHNPDGSESLWCYTKPEAMYGKLLEALGHFPLQHFWGPMANIEGSRWIVSSANWLMEREKPNFLYLYLPHLDYAAQKHGPNSPEAQQACSDLDVEIGRLMDHSNRVLEGSDPLWLVASEYAITEVNHNVAPNRVLREAGLLQVKLDQDGRELIDGKASSAWALADHQHSHVYVRDSDPTTISHVVDLFRKCEGIAQVWSGEELERHGVAHARSGEVVLISESWSWQSYYYWLDEAMAPAFARTVDIHRKPGYDPVELFWDPALAKQHGGGVPLDASLVKGSHGAPADADEQRGVMLSSATGVFVERTMSDIDVCEMVLRQFGV